ncbi:MAG TPA: hypothetical protein PK624_06385 [Spirochaetota bacterium]|nr:hypothetical protein [Spirochaetota bacterium]HOR44405.1 hypothetical protein [Spirochaetota bacterium]HPK55904.1 hypothetical protein [Spirochaetota bacterium]
MEYFLLFLSIFLSLTSLLVSAFLFIRIERLLEKKFTFDKSFIKKKESIKKNSINSIKEEQKKNYKDVILKAEKKYFRNITNFIGLFFLSIGLLFFAGYAFSQISPIIRFIILNIFSISLLIAGFILQRYRNTNIAIILKTLSGAMLLFSAVGSSRFQLLHWTDNELHLIIVSLFSVSANVIIAYVKSEKNWDKVHLLLTLFALSFLNQINCIFVISAIFSFTAAIIYLKRNNLFSIYYISFIYFAYQLYISFNSVYYLSLSNNVGIVSSVVISLFPLFFYIFKKKLNETSSKFSYVLYLLNISLFFITIYQYSINIEIKELLLFGSAFILYFITKKGIISIYQYIKTANIIAIIVMILYALYSLKDFNISNGLIVCFSIIFLYIMLSIEIKDRILFNVISIIQIILIAGLIYLIRGNAFTNNSELVKYGIIAVVSGILFIVFRSNYTKVKEINNKVWFISGILPSIIFSALVVSTAFTFHNYLLWGVFLILSTIISFGLRKASLKYGQIISVFVYCINGFLHFEASQTIISSLYHFLPFFIIPLINLFYYSENNDPFCRFVSMFTMFSSVIWFCYKLLFPVSAPLPGVIYLLLSLISFEVGDLFSSTKVKMLFRLKNNFYLWGFFLSCLFIVFHVAVILNSEKYFDIKGLHFQVRLFIEIAAILVFLYYCLSQRRISNIIIEKLYNFNVELLVLLIILAVKSQIQRIYHSPIWVIISFLIFFCGKYINGNPWRLKVYSVFFCLASMIQTAFYLGTKVSVDASFIKQGWFLGIIAISLQCVFIIIIRQNKYLENSDLSSKTGIINNIKNQIQLKYDRYLYYLLFLCIALYINTSFDQSFHSFLWLIESFIIYIVGVIHKDKVLRMISVSFILFCVLRMIFVDLKEQNLIIKSAVFFMSGILLILINIIYKKKVYSNEN